MCFRAHTVVSLGECSMWAWEECAVCCCWSWLMVLFSSTLSLLIFCLLDLSVADWGALRPPSTIVNESISLWKFSQILLHIFWCPLVRCIYIMNCYISPLLCNASLLFLIIFLALKIAPSEINIATPAFFWFMLAWFIFLIIFTFNIPVSFFFLFFFLELHLRHMEVSRLEVESELQLPAYTTGIATQDPSLLCNLYNSSQQLQIPNPLSKAGDTTCIPMDSSQIHFCCATTRTPSLPVSLYLKWISYG